MQEFAGMHFSPEVLGFSREQGLGLRVQGLGLYWGCIGVILRMYWGYIEDVLGLF